MAIAIIEGRPSLLARPCAARVDVMTSILRRAMGAFVEMQTTCTRPEPLDPEAARGLLV